MKQTFDTDTILFDALKASSAITDTITGDVYVMGERPDDSEKEDIVINTITLSQDSEPQKGVSNVNIHVPDIDVRIAGRTQKKANRKRLKDLSTIVLEVLRAVNIEGFRYWISLQTTIKVPEISQHFVNLRIEWNIH